MFAKLEKLIGGYLKYDTFLPHRVVICLLCVQEADGEPSVAELQEKLTLKCGDEELSKTVNGRLAAASGVDRTVFDDF